MIHRTRVTRSTIRSTVPGIALAIHQLVAQRGRRAERRTRNRARFDTRTVRVHRARVTRGQVAVEVIPRLAIAIVGRRHCQLVANVVTHTVRLGRSRQIRRRASRRTRQTRRLVSRKLIRAARALRKTTTRIIKTRCRDAVRQRNRALHQRRAARRARRTRLCANRIFVRPNSTEFTGCSMRA